MRETIETLDMNFTNQAGGHTATVGTVANAKNIDGTDGLGTVIGNLGEFNEFSNTKIAEKMKNFICVSITNSSDANRDTVTRNYVDRSTLLLESHLVLLRGENAPPEGGSTYDGPVPYFTEVAGSPLKSFKKSGPKKVGHVIYAGSIYNVESAQRFDGVKIKLIYQNKKLVENLCLNSDFASPAYKGSPDLSQYNLSFGYTIADFRTMLEIVGLKVTGLPSDSDILLTESGNLSSVATAIASKLGLFWYVNPENGSINFMNTAVAASIKLDDFSKTADQDVTTSSFTRSLRKNLVVNTYTGSAEKKPDEEEKSFTTEDRPRPVFFKRVMWDRSAAFQKIMTGTELGCFYALYQQNEKTKIKDTFIFFLLFLNRKGLVRKILGLNRDINITNMYPYRFTSLQLRDFYKRDGVDYGTKDNPNKNRGYLLPKATAEAEKSGFRKSNIVDGKNKKLDRFDEKFQYIRLNSVRLDSPFEKKDPDEEDQVDIPNGEIGIKPKRPTDTVLDRFLKAYFSIAGGIYITNSYSKYKAERMDFQNTADLAISGPFKKDETVAEIDELSDLADLMNSINIDPEKTDIETLAKLTRGESVIGNDFYFLGMRPLKQLERVQEDKPINFEDMELVTEFAEFDASPSLKGKEFLGGTEKFMQNSFAKFFQKALIQSRTLFKNAIDFQSKIKCTYLRGKTRVNPIGEEDEEQEDNDVSGSSDDDQALADLFDRYDLKYYCVESPSYDLMNKISHSSSSGSTTDMKLLKAVRGSMAQDSGEQMSSSRTLYGLHLPTFRPTMNSVSVSVTSAGITTSIKESTIKLIPPDQTVLIDRANNALRPDSPISTQISASQKNFMGL